MYSKYFPHFPKMGNGSRLYINESGVKVVYLLNNPLPTPLASLDWVRETEQTLSKLLGIFMGTSISLATMFEHLDAMLNKRRKMACLHAYTLSVRVIVANQMVVRLTRVLS